MVSYGWKAAPCSVLFQHLSEIAGGPFSDDFETYDLTLGEVLLDGQPDSVPRSLVLVISPACDLARCNVSYEVLGVRGVADEFKNDLADVLSSSFRLLLQGDYRRCFLRDALMTPMQRFVLLPLLLCPLCRKYEARTPPVSEVN